MEGRGLPSAKEASASCFNIIVSLDHLFAADLLQLPQTFLISLYPLPAECVKRLPVTVCFPCVSASSARKSFWSIMDFNTFELHPILKTKTLP